MLKSEREELIAKAFTIYAEYIINMQVNTFMQVSRIEKRSELDIKSVFLMLTMHAIYIGFEFGYRYPQEAEYMRQAIGRALAKDAFEHFEMDEKEIAELLKNVYDIAISIEESQDET